MHKMELMIFKLRNESRLVRELDLSQLNLGGNDVVESKMFLESSLANSSPLLLQDSVCPVDTDFS